MPYDLAFLGKHCGVNLKSFRDVASKVNIMLGYEAQGVCTIISSIGDIIWNPYVHLAGFDGKSCRDNRGSAVHHSLHPKMILGKNYWQVVNVICADCALRRNSLVSSLAAGFRVIAIVIICSSHPSNRDCSVGIKDKVI